MQLRAGSEAVRDLFRGLGVTQSRAHEKRVPTAIFTAPVEVQAAFLRGLFGADGCLSRAEGAGKANRYAGLGSRSEALLKDVQRLLSARGGSVRASITSRRARRHRSRTRASTEPPSVRLTRRLRPAHHRQRPCAVCRRDRLLHAAEAGRARSSDRRADSLSHARRPQRSSRAKSDGQEQVYNLTEPLHHSYIVDGVVVANCSEYMHVDDSACNLASINLMKFRREDGSFDVERFEHVVDVVLLAQEIIVGPSSYPTEQIGANARAFRQLGLGYANLGALLMSNGMPYDSDAGRGAAAAITALMTARGYAQSARVAAALGPYERYAENREPHNAVMRMHRDAAYAVADTDCPDSELLAAARSAWDRAVALGEEHGYRNAQATVLAPTGTISFFDGLRHDRRRAGLLARQVQGARRRRPDDDRQPHGAARAAHARLRARAGRADRRPHQPSTARSSGRPASPRSTCPSSTSPSASGRSRTWATSR